MMTLVLKGLLMVADMSVQVPEQPAPQVTEKVQEAPKRVEGKVDCYPWFPERNYQCPSPKDNK